MQFKVPQDVQREDHIIGPLTLKQLIICGIGGSIAYAIYVSLGKDYTWITWLPPVAIIGIITIAFAFIRPLDMSFIQWILRWIEYSLIPRERFWIQTAGEVMPVLILASTQKTKVQTKAEAKAENIIDKHKKLEELSKMLDEHG